MRRPLIAFRWRGATAEPYEVHLVRIVPRKLPVSVGGRRPTDTHSRRYTLYAANGESIGGARTRTRPSWLHGGLEEYRP